MENGRDRRRFRASAKAIVRLIRQMLLWLVGHKTYLVRRELHHADRYFVRRLDGPRVLWQKEAQDWRHAWDLTENLMFTHTIRHWGVCGTDGHLTTYLDAISLAGI